MTGHPSRNPVVGNRFAWFFALCVTACTMGAGDDDLLDASSGIDAAHARDAGVVQHDGGNPVDGGGERDTGAIRGDGGAGRDCAADEICGNGLDDECDGTVDDSCPCTPGDVASCFRGDPRARGLGRCADGRMVCEGFEFGTWGACVGDVLEEVESCDAAGADEDCDGAPNDGCECVDGDPDVACGTDIGECAAGIQRCIGGLRTACDGAIGGRGETCDGTDEDCDGRIDEALTRVCGGDTGACRTGVQHCDAGAWGLCVGEAAPTDETCDGVDEDCDGTVDELVMRTCGSDVGRCVAGIERCEGGVFTVCEGAVVAIAETCNAQDDDCDGVVDEGQARVCGSGVGACRAGTEVCRAGRWGTCEGNIDAALETCDGTIDQDCDGAVDEGCGCTTGRVRSCGTDVGRCMAGTQTCNGSGAWGACTGAVDPRAETCDGIDDDCDGLRDEGCDCVTGTVRACGSDVGECARGTETCDVAGHWGPCSGATGPATELCNTRDDDCDASVDEDDVCPRFPPVAICPAPRAGLVGDAIAFAGSGNDPDGGALSYAWSVVVRPSGSSATPVPTSAASTVFTPDVDGAYTLRLCVTDDESVQTCCTTSVAAAPRCTPPTAPTITSCGTSWDRRPIVELPPLPAGLVYELFADAEGMPYGTVTTVGQNYFRPATAIGAGGPPPAGERVSITARACRTDDRTCCASSAPVTVSMIEACTTPIAPTSANIVFSEYVIDGDGSCAADSGVCEAGEAIEITNLSNCPVALEGSHFSYCNGSCSSTTYRWMDFGAADVIPPRGVYVAIRDLAGSMCSYPFFGTDDPGLFGLRVSQLEMQGSNLAGGWFSNGGGAMSQLRVATGAWSSPTSGTTLERVAPYTPNSLMCGSVGFDAIDACGDVTSVSTPTEQLMQNQLGRLWHPCDAVSAPVPASCR